MLFRTGETINLTANWAETGTSSSRSLLVDRGGRETRRTKEVLIVRQKVRGGDSSQARLKQHRMVAKTVRASDAKEPKIRLTCRVGPRHRRANFNLRGVTFLCPSSSLCPCAACSIHRYRSSSLFSIIPDVISSLSPTL